MPGSTEEEKINASDYPAFYYAKHMAPGLAGYEDETILVDMDALKEMIPSFIGKPIVVFHQDINLDNLESKDGTVIESFYNELDGCLWTKNLIETDAARAAIAQGWKVSNCYQPTEWGPGGLHHNVPYDRRIVNGTFRHLAIVPNPRYEEADILTPDEFKIYQEEKKAKLKLLQNSKEGKKMKFWKTKKEEVTQVDDDTMITLENGQDVSLKEMINSVTASAKKNSKENEEKVNMDSKVAVGDTEMSIGELVTKYNAMCKANKPSDEESEEEKAKKAKEKEDGEKKNAQEADAKKALEALEALKTAESLKYFKDLMNASTSATPLTPKIETTTDKVSRGSELYGSGK